MKFKSYNRR